MDNLVQNPEAQKIAQMLQEQQTQKFLRALQGAGSGAMSDADMLMAQGVMGGQPNYGMQPVPMDGQAMQQGPFMQQPAQMFGRAIPQGGLGGNPAPMPTVNSSQGAMSELDRRMMMQQGMGQGAMSNSDYQMMRKR